MANHSYTVAVVGCTGLVGSQILQTLVNLPSPLQTHALSRRAIPTDLPSPPLHAHISNDTDSWPGVLSALNPPPTLFLSALGTTKAQAGSIAAQRAVDVTLNLSLARAARSAGVSTYVLISVSGASSNALLPYPKMKGEVEEEVKKLGFEHTVILRPGVILGKREDSRPAEFAVQKAAGWVGGLLGVGWRDPWAQEAEVIARAAVKAGKECVEGKREKAVWVLNQADIVRLGRKEWEGGK